MRIRLTFYAEKENSTIPVNYQYPVSAAIYKILQRADQEYSQFLHKKGYGRGFKMFSFSDLNIPFKIMGDRLLLLSSKAEMIVCFHLPRAAETFIKGLFKSQQFVIADKESKTAFTIQNVEVVDDKIKGLKEEEEVKVVLKPLSPVVCGIKNEKGNYIFLSPEEDRFEEMIWLNWQEKVRSIYEKPEADYLMDNAFVRVMFFKNPPKSRLMTIKADTPEQTKIRGYNNFLLEITGKKTVAELILNAGVGVYNAQGMGCVEIVEP
ncbi:MAG: CRISPR-associated endoribonuclease Cas6 [Ginsengibacter sp.]